MLHKEEFLTDLENMILQLVQRVMNLETGFKNKLHQYRESINDSNKHVDMPNYENLLNAKKFHLKKLIHQVTFENTSPESQESTILVLKFNQNKLF